MRKAKGPTSGKPNRSEMLIATLCRTSKAIGYGPAQHQSAGIPRNEIESEDRQVGGPDKRDVLTAREFRPSKAVVWGPPYFTRQGFPKTDGMGSHETY